MPSYPDLAAYARWNDYAGQSFDLDVVRDGGGKTPTKVGSGTVSIDYSSKFGGGSLKFAGDAAAHLYWSGADIIDALVNTLTVEFFVRPLYSGSPSAFQFFHTSCKQSGSSNNCLYIFHSSINGYLYCDFYRSTGALIGSIGGPFTPNGSSWYHIAFSANYNSGSEAHRLFIDGVQVGATDTTAGVRDGSSQLMRIGSNVGGSSYLAKFAIDDLRLWDIVKYTSNFTPPDAQLGLEYGSDVISPAIIGEALDPKIAAIIRTGTKGT